MAKANDAAKRRKAHSTERAFDERLARRKAAKANKPQPLDQKGKKDGAEETKKKLEEAQKKGFKDALFGWLIGGGIGLGLITIAVIVLAVRNSGTAQPAKTGVKDAYKNVPPPQSAPRTFSEIKAPKREEGK